MNPNPSVLLGLICAGLLSGCSTPSHLVYLQSTSIGADAALNTDTGQTHVSFGYDRQTSTLIPKTTTKNEDGSTEEVEAMSVVSASEVKIKWLGLHQVTEQFATGKAARNLARDPNAVGQIVTLTVPTEKKP
jgi:hypothetical protein